MTTYNIDTADLGTNHYQPIVLDSTFWHTLDQSLLAGAAERLSVSRLKIIQDELADAVPGQTFFDIGCNIGIFCHFANLSKQLTAVGIDNNSHVEVKNFTDHSSIDTAKKLNEIYGSDAVFLTGDYFDHLTKSYDYINYLSVWHHHFIGYGHCSDRQQLTTDQCFDLLNQVCTNARKKLFFEHDPAISQVPHERMVDFFQQHGAVRVHSIDEPSKLVNYKFSRSLYVIDKT